MSAERQSGFTSGDENDTRRALQVSALAQEQGGVVSLAQLAACGLSRTTVLRWARDGRLHRVTRSVYAAGHPTLTARGWWMAGALACGEGSLVAYRSALAVYGVIAPASTIDVITPNRRGGGLRGIRAHRCAVHSSERGRFHGIPVTSLSRAFLDAATQLRPEQLAMALNESLLLERYDHAEMLATLARHVGDRGVRRLRSALADVGDEAIRYRSRAEAKARMAIAAAGLEIPETNAWFPTRAGHGHELDLYWRRLRLNVEIDGPRHELPWQKRSDALRDADLRAVGVIVVRFRDTDVDHRPGWFLAQVAALLRRVSSPSRGW